MPARVEVKPRGHVTATAPDGFASFCARVADQCSPSPEAAPTLRLDTRSWSAIERVNLHVNGAVKPETDEKHYGVEEYWTIVTDGFGDCEDYALTKRKELIEAGLPEPALRMAIVVTLRNERHSVLTVATDRGDFVLDNLTNDILPWNATGYSWVASQDAIGKLGWVVFNGDDRNIRSVATAGMP